MKQKGITLLPSIRAGVASATAVVVLALIVTGLYVMPGAEPSQHGRLVADGLIVFVSVLLTLASGLTVQHAVIDAIEVRIADRYGRSVIPADRLAVNRQLDAALYHFLGKFALCTAAVIIATARAHGLRLFLQTHPLFLLLLLVVAMVLFTVVDVLAVPYRKEAAAAQLPPTLAHELAELADRVAGDERRIRIIEQTITDTVLPEPDYAHGAPRTESKE